MGVCPGFTIYMLQLYFHYLISTFSEPCYNSTPKSHTNPKKSHYHPKKSKFSLKSQKKNPNFFFFWAPFCYKNVDKMFYQPQKVPFSPPIFLYFFHILCKKSHIYTYILNLAPSH